MDPIQINSYTPSYTVKNNNNRSVSFRGSGFCCDIFERQGAEKKPAILDRFRRAVQTFFMRNTTIAPEEPVNIEPYEQTIEVVDENKTELGRFLESKDYDEKMKKALQGKYFDNMYELLKKENLSDSIKEEFQRSNLSEEEFLNALKMLSKSTFKAGLNNPKQYINYTQDAAYERFIIDSLLKNKSFKSDTEKARAYMAEFFAENITKLAQAARYTDSDTLNQMMDKRTMGFKLMLHSLNKINDENGALLKELIGKTKEGDAKQKIKLCQLVEIFQSNGFNMDVLKELNEKGEIDSSALNEIFKEAIVKKTGATVNEKTRTDFNEEYFHLLFSERPVMNNGVRTYESIFNTFLKEAIEGNFEEFIADENNEYGKANKNTKEAFNSRGLNYENWLHPNIDTKTFNLKGKKMSLQMWERNPFEDIFLGNKTRCCTAIATGSNSCSMPLFIMNTAFNVIELKNEKGNTVGMARIYMAEVEGKNSVVIDSIELSDIKELKDEDKKAFAENIFDYTREFAKTITGEDTDVYYIQQDSKLNLNSIYTSDVIQNEFIGDVSVDKIYSNRNSGEKWGDIRGKGYAALYKA